MFKRLAIDVLLAIFFLSVLSSTQLSAQGPAQREACRKLAGLATEVARLKATFVIKDGDAADD